MTAMRGHVWSFSLISSLAMASSAQAQTVDPLPAFTGGGPGASAAYIVVQFGVKHGMTGPWVVSQPNGGAHCAITQYGTLSTSVDPAYGSASYDQKSVVYVDPRGVIVGSCSGLPELLVTGSYTWTAEAAAKPIDPFTFCYVNTLSTAPCAIPVVAELIPTTETSVLKGFLLSDPIAAVFYQTLAPVGVNYNGTVVKEFDATSGTDTCYYDQSIISKQTGVTGSSWMIGTEGASGAGGNTIQMNQWGPDGVGWSRRAVVFYQQFGNMADANPLPCSFTLQQQMKIQFGNGDNTFYNYGKVNVLSATINVKSVSFSRAGHSASRSYP